MNKYALTTVAALPRCGGASAGLEAEVNKRRLERAWVTVFASYDGSVRVTVSATPSFVSFGGEVSSMLEKKFQDAK